MLNRGAVWRVLGVAFVFASLTVSGHSVAQDRELTEASDFRVRVQAALRLGRSGTPQSRTELERGLRDTHPAVRVACAAGLGNVGDTSSIPALEQAMKSESYATVKSAMKDTIDKLRSGKSSAAVAGAGASAPGAAANAPAGGGGDPAVAIDKAKYVVQLGAMRNVSGVRSNDLDAVMLAAAKTRASSIKNAVVLEGANAAAVKKATDRRIPVLLVDGNLTKLTQTTTSSGAVVVTAKVDMSIRRVPRQTLEATVSGNASGSGDGRASEANIADLQNRVVGGAVESALNSMSSEIAMIAKH